MATQHHRQQPSRLFIPPMLNSQLANAVDTRTMFSPAIATASQAHFPPHHINSAHPLHSAHPLNSGFPLQTPLNTAFFPHPSHAPQRPPHLGHRQHASMAQLAAAGIHPPVPMTPLGQGQFPQQMLHGSGLPGPGMPPQPFVPKSRRTPSMIGGPPKAALGGPGRKVSPMPPAAIAAAEKLKGKKVLVKLPVETIKVEAENEKDVLADKPLWTRTPVPLSLFPEVPPPETTSAETYPAEVSKKALPPTVDVFLPGRDAWDQMKNRIIEEKLEKLGVIERRPDFVTNVPEIHARAASISSPADPALLMFKLNKLQQTQIAGSSLSPSPQLPSSSTLPNPKFPPRLPAHGHSMSLAQPPTFQNSTFNGPGGFELLASDSGGNVVTNSASTGGLYAPQGRVPAQLSVPSVPSRPESRPDFIRGFGLDIPEEEEEEGEKEDIPPVEAAQPAPPVSEPPDHTYANAPTSEDVYPSVTQDSDPGVEQTDTHTRHASRISVTLSVGSAPRHVDDTMVAHSRKASRVSIEMGQYVKDLDEHEIGGEVNDPLNEWTGSEDVRSTTGMSDDDQESIGEWSNPSDEERARQERLHRQYMRRMQSAEEEMPRRIPEFPRPPEEDGETYVALRGDEDIVSNPSDEEDNRVNHFTSHAAMEMDDLYYISGMNGRTSRPLPPLPHSRDGSNHFSMPPSLPSHSRGASEHFGNAFMNGPQTSSLPISRPDSSQHGGTPSISSSSKNLNPFAKPFVFGARPSFIASSVSPSVPENASSLAASSPAQASVPSHSRLPSLGSSRMLNAAAQEFKPGMFTFRPPGEVPALSFPEPAPATIIEASRPLPEPPLVKLGIRAVQGREKRQRMSQSPSTSEADESDASFSDDEDGHDTMSSFKFPPGPEPTMVFHRSAPSSPTPASGRVAALSAAAKPFTFSGFSNLPPVLPPLLGQEQRTLSEEVLSSPNGEELLSVNATRGSGLVDDVKSPELTLPNIHKQKRAPIPLDFKHPVSTNMVPAGLFKNSARADTEERTRRTYGSSLEFSEHRSEISLDDLSVPAISHKVTRGRLANESENQDDGSHDEYVDRSGASEAPTHSRRSSTGIPDSPDSIVPPDMASFSQALRMEERLDAILDKKIEMLRDDILAHMPLSRDGISDTTEQLVREAMAMFRTQLRDNAEKALEDSTMDARGELDFEMLKSIVEQGHEDARKYIQQDLADILQNIRESEGSASPHAILELVRGFQDLKVNTLASNAHLVDRLSAIEAASSSYPGALQDRNAFIFEIVSALTPQIATLRSEPIDYEGLTLRLSQAVKPHITQLIDLASDKRETADLIANRLMPILQSFASTPTEIDTENLVSEMTASINRIISPIDTHVIKEQVADLVVERLDARLSVRDNNLNFDIVKTKVEDSISPLLERFDSLSEGFSALSRDQNDVSTRTRDILSGQSDSLKNIENLTEIISDIAETTNAVKSLVKEQQRMALSSTSNLERIESTLQMIGSSSEDLAVVKDEIVSNGNRLLDELSPLADTISTSVESKFAEFMARLKQMQDSSQELRKLTSSNSDLQIQLTKARAQHGQIRVEKENLNSRVAEAEVERDRLRAKTEELQSASLAQAAEFAALEARNIDQERAMHTALDRLKISDVTAQTQQDRIGQLEKDNRDLALEKQQLKSKVDSLEMQLEFSVRDRESAQQTLRLLQADRDHLAAQQSHWEDLRRAAEQIEMLTNLVGRGESEEVAELKRMRDRSKVLEGEHAALQRRFKEQESKIVNIERASLTARQNFAQAQQRAAEWEKKAREFEGEVERLTTVVDQGEQTMAQLEADQSLAKLQLEERDAEERVIKDRERKLEEEIASLKTKISDLSSELEEERKVSRAASGQWAAVHSHNRNGVRQARPSSRASTAYDAPKPTTPQLNGRSISHSNHVASQPQTRAASANASASAATPSPPPTSSTWDSIHAPTHAKVPAYTPTPATPRAQRASNYNHNGRALAPSPTPSIVSLAPTQGDDGWWS